MAARLGCLRSLRLAVAAGTAAAVLAGTAGTVAADPGGHGHGHGSQASGAGQSSAPPGQSNSNAAAPSAAPPAPAPQASRGSGSGGHGHGRSHGGQGGGGGHASAHGGGNQGTSTPTGGHAKKTQASTMTTSTTTAASTQATRQSAGGATHGAKKSPAGQGASQASGTQGATQSPASAPASTAVPAPALAPAPAGAAQPASAPAAATPAPAPASGLTSHGRGTRHRGGGHRLAGRPVSGAAGAAVGRVTPASAGTAGPGSSTVAPGRSPHRATGRRAGHPASATATREILRTLTKIIGVIPLAVRILIALLAAVALALAASSRLVALRARRLERQRRSLLADVGVLQAALLPTIPERHGLLETSVAYQPADGPAAGGDFYDVFELGDGRLGVIVGDLSGHGRQALPHTALVRYTLRAYMEAGLSPRSALRSTGPVLERQLGGSFATVAAASFDPDERVLDYATAGHPPPVILGNRLLTPLTPLTACASPPIGIGVVTGLRQTRIALPGEAVVFFYTDGLADARSGGVLFGRERLAEVLAELGPAADARAVLDAVIARTDQRPDDMAGCLLHLPGDSRPPVVLAEELEIDPDEDVAEHVDRFLSAAGVARSEVAGVSQAALARVSGAHGIVVEARFHDGTPAVELRAGDSVLLRRAVTGTRERRRMAR